MSHSSERERAFEAALAEITEWEGVGVWPSYKLVEIAKSALDKWPPRPTLNGVHHD